MAAPSPSQIAVTLAVASALFMTAAVWNGYPLTFWDTRAYVEHAATLMPRPDRVIGYSILIRLLGFRQTLWPVAIAQCVLVAALSFRVLAVATGHASLGRFLLLSLALTVGTALPWIAGQIMPDIFTPVLVLALFLSLEDRALGRAGRALLLGLIALCATIHLTHVPLGLGVLGASCALGMRRHEARTLSRHAVPALALAAGLVAIASFNGLRAGHVTLARGSDAFVLAHLVESGIAERLLDEHCPNPRRRSAAARPNPRRRSAAARERDYLLCPERAKLPLSTDELLWVDRLQLQPWKHTEAISREAHRLLLDSLREHPGLHARVALDYTLRGLVRFRTGEGLDADAAYLIEPQIAAHAPLDLGAYRAARQQHDAIPVTVLRSVHDRVGALLLALGLLAAASSLFSRASTPSQRLLGLVTIAYVLNAILSANLSGIYDRYQSRLLWLFALALAADAPRLRTFVRGCAGSPR